MAKLKGLYSVLNHVPEKLQRVSNRLGETVSRTVALSVLDQVSENYDRQAKECKGKVELLYQGSFSARKMQSLANSTRAKGGAFFSDNVGKVREMMNKIQIFFVDCQTPVHLMSSKFKYFLLIVKPKFSN